MSEHFTRPTRSLSSRVAIVTGAGTAGTGIGNGRAAAILLAEAGCSVVCVDLQEELAAKTVEMIHSEGFGKAVALRGDVSDEGDCRRVVEEAKGKFGRVDILINTVVSLSFLVLLGLVGGEDSDVFVLVVGNWGCDGDGCGG